IPNLIIEIIYRQHSKIIDTLFMIFYVQNFFLDATAPAEVVFVELPTTDKIDTEILVDERKICSIPRKLVMIDVDYLLHQHPNLVFPLLWRHERDLGAYMLCGIPVGVYRLNPITFVISEGKKSPDVLNGARFKIGIIIVWISREEPFSFHRKSVVA